MSDNDFKTEIEAQFGNETKVVITTDSNGNKIIEIQGVDKTVTFFDTMRMKKF